MFISFICGVIFIFLNQVNSQNRVINGYSAKSHQFPYQVSLSRKTIWGVPSEIKQSHFCGGSIVNESWIITAAYCVYKLPTSSKIYVLAGKHFLNETEIHQQNRLVIAIIVHKYYPGLYAQHDIALLKLNEPFIINNYVKSVALPKTHETPVADVYWLSGWGSVSRDDRAIMSNELRTYYVPVIDLNTCRDSINEANVNMELYQTQLCTGPLLGSIIVAPCIGDSGGPLVKNSAYGPKLVGIVSWGLRPCGVSPISSVYTRVSSYIDWIRNITTSRLPQSCMDICFL